MCCSSSHHRSLTLLAVSERMGSPNKVRIGHLSEKLVSLQDELEHEKQVPTDPRCSHRIHGHVAPAPLEVSV